MVATNAQQIKDTVNCISNQTSAPRVSLMTALSITLGLSKIVDANNLKRRRLSFGQRLPAKTSPMCMMRRASILRATVCTTIRAIVAGQSSLAQQWTWSFHLGI